jgi:riboflavin biosynthesis pyrimidine reductase
MKGFFIYLSLPLVISGRVIEQTLRQDGLVDVKEALRQLGTNEISRVMIES